MKSNEKFSFSAGIYMIEFIHETFANNESSNHYVVVVAVVSLLLLFSLLLLLFLLFLFGYCFQLFLLLLLLLLRLFNWSAKFDKAMSFPDSWRRFQFPF